MLRLLFTATCGILGLACTACSSSSPGTGDSAAAYATPSPGPASASSPAPDSGSSSSRTVVPVTSPLPAFKNLPAGWHSFDSWTKRVAELAGPKVVASSGLEDPGNPQNGYVASWTWSAASTGGQTMAIVVYEDTHKNPIQIRCALGGPDPSSASVAATARSLFSLCASADFPGADTAAAQRWMPGRLATVMAAQRRDPKSAVYVGIYPFGGAVYRLGGDYTPEDGLSLFLQIEGPVIR
jgi:hypothetical protein